ncbi:MAG: phosphate ABC transporter permease PstA [Caldimicrobium sp.]
MILKRKLINNLSLIFCTLTALWGLFWLFFIIIDVIRHGLVALTPTLLLNDPSPPGVPGGGLKHAIIGHLLITLCATLLGVPIGILGGTFLAEYGRNMRLSKVISFLADIMVSIPAIIVGAFIYALLVKPMGHFSGLAGGIALAIIMIPVIIRTTENMLSLIPWSLREAAFALGAPYYKVIFQVVYRGAGAGIFTGVILAIARVTGEAAPLLFTSFNNAFTSYNLFQPMASLTVTIFQYAMGPYEDWHKQAWGASFLITLVILFLSIVGRYLIKRRFRD